MGKLIAVDKRKWDGSVSAGAKALLLETEQAGASAAAIGQTHAWAEIANGANGRH